MSNYGLQSEVNRLESQLREIEMKNDQLRHEINSTVNSVNQAENELSAYNQYIRETLDDAADVINNSVNRALSAYELQGEIDQLYTRYKCIELANKKIRSLNNKKYYDFNNYRTVRKIVQGMMDNLDLHMMGDAVIYKAIEKQHLVTPDYWLTCALISIMGWRSDDKELANRALRNAIKIDLKSSSMFYMIFNLRMDRNQAAAKWFLEYQKCELKGSDENTFLMLFSLISKTLSDNIDDETVRMIFDYIHYLIEGCAEKKGYSESNIIFYIQNYLQSFLKTETYELPLLAKYCSDYSSILKMLNLAHNNYNILEFILEIVNVSVDERNTYLKEYLSELLASPNQVEMETYDEIEYNELIIKMSGDIENAKKKYEEEQQHRAADFNIISTIISWIYDFNNENISGQMRLNMFTLVKKLHEKAVDSYLKNYRSMFRKVHPVSILDYSTKCNFSNETGEQEKVENYYNEQQERELAVVKNLSAYIFIGIGAACGVTAFFVNLLLLIGLGIGIVSGIGILTSNSYKRKNIILNIQKQKENVLDILHKLFVENEKMNNMYKDFDNVSARIAEELAKL